LSRAAIHALARRAGSLHAQTFRNACTLFATGVTVATVRAPDGSLHGLTISSFTPVSIEPPLILICVGHGCTSLPHFRACTHFAVNVLAESQREIAVAFAEKDQDRFEGVDWYLSQSGVPLLRGSLATFECQLEAIIEAGDHAIFLAEVVNAESQGGQPLLYFQRDYRAPR
jgi:flavin reductase (DIM6/NTAB) family NADH-FMN oxidoreductase RutF